MVYIFTISFPYYKALENSFLQHEIPYLQKRFKKVVIFPLMIEGLKQELPADVEINEELSKYLLKHAQKNYLYYAFFSNVFFKEILENIGIIYYPRKVLNLLYYITQALLTKKWFKSYCLVNQLNPSNVLLYTYWCTPITLGLGLYKKKYKDTTLITRAHGIDLFEERGNVFCRKQTIKLLDDFYLVSENGLNYIKSLYPLFSYKFKLAPLGVKHLGFLTKCSDKGFFNIVSCSSIDSNKRVDLTFKGIVRAAEINKDIEFIWYHFGDGVLMKELKEMISQIKVQNLICHLKGLVSNNAIFDYYKNNPVDLFISTSVSEGGRPVSMQEAVSCGIPILGTNVGGIPEIINHGVGRLLSVNPSLDEIAHHITSFAIDKSSINYIRKKCFETWEKHLNADLNFESFASNIKFDDHN